VNSCSRVCTISPLVVMVNFLYRFCYPCSENEDPKSLLCELCPFTGGAYKHTDKPHKWAHSICANWIPEVFEVQEPDKPLYLSLRHVDKKRFGLKCAICGKKGGCVQCAYGRCTTAAHSWCALRNTNAGYTHRIIKDGAGDTLWEIFCKTHAAAVSEPVKHKKSYPKTSITLQPQDFSSPPVMWLTHPNGAAQSVVSIPANFCSLTQTVSTTSRTPAMSVMKKDRESRGDRERLLLPIVGVEEDWTPLEDENWLEMELQKEEKRTNFPVVSLTEWPGLSVGEGMGSEHFWNYISACYPEEYSDTVRDLWCGIQFINIVYLLMVLFVQWLSVMLDASRPPTNWKNAIQTERALSSATFAKTQDEVSFDFISAPLLFIMLWCGSWKSMWTKFLTNVLIKTFVQ
jgi:hypothetical protein